MSCTTNTQTGVAVQSHQLKFDDISEVLEYSLYTTNFLLHQRSSGYAKAYQQARDKRYAEGVILGALQQARYMTKHYAKQMIANPKWCPQIHAKFILLPENHYSIQDDKHLYAPLGTSHSDIAPLRVRLDDSIYYKISQSHIRDVLVTHNRIYIIHT